MHGVLRLGCVVLPLALWISDVQAQPSRVPAVAYQLQCMGCHGADGSGEPGRVPSLRSTLVRLSMFPEGREFILRVPGVAQSVLSDDQTAELLNWMARRLSDLSVPDRFMDYTGAEVARWRHQPLAAVRSVRQGLMQRLEMD